MKVKNLAERRGTSSLLLYPPGLLNRSTVTLFIKFMKDQAAYLHDANVRRLFYGLIFTKTRMRT